MSFLYRLQIAFVVTLHFFGNQSVGWYSHWDGYKNFSGPHGSRLKAFCAMPDHIAKGYSSSEESSGIEWRWRKAQVPYKW